MLDREHTHPSELRLRIFIIGLMTDWYDYTGKGANIQEMDIARKFLPTLWVISDYGIASNEESLRQVHVGLELYVSPEDWSGFGRKVLVDSAYTS